MSVRSITLIILLLPAIAGITQPRALDKPTEAAVVSYQTNEIRSKAFSPFGASSLSNFFSNISISSFFKEGVNGKMELQYKFHPRLSAGLSIDQKIGSNVKVATPISLTGISPGTTVEVNLQKMFWNPHFMQSDDQIKALMKVTEAYGRRKRMSDSIQGIKISATFDPRNIGLLSIDSNGTDEERRVVFEAFNSINKPLFVNVKAGFTKTSYAYTTDSVTLGAVSDAFLTPTVTISLVQVLGVFRVTGYVALSYNFSESYTPADDITFNLPFGTTRNFYSTTVAFGKPEKSTTSNVMLEYRRNILGETKGGNLTNIAISPSATLGINSKKLSFFLPIYLIRGSNENGKLLDGLQGGVRFGFITSAEPGKGNNFKDGFIAQLIISQPLDFLSKF